MTREGATTLVDFVVKAGLEETLSGDGPFTIFAPTNEAFEKLDQSLVDELMANPEELKKILLYHVVPSEVKSSDIYLDDLLVDSAEGTKLRVNTYMKRFYYDVSFKFLFFHSALVNFFIDCDLTAELPMSRILFPSIFQLLRCYP